MSYLCKEPEKSIIGTYVDDGHGNYKGECVSLVKRLCTVIMPAKATWKQGDPVKGASAPARGTAIASFDEHSKAGHAAIYVSQDQHGILVWDQYQGKPVGSSRIRFGNKHRPHYNADNFCVIK